MINWYKKVVFGNYANFKGRARRKEFWNFQLCSILIGISLMAVDNLSGTTIGPTHYGYFFHFYCLAIFLPGLAVMVRRLHDIGKSGKLLLVLFILCIIGSVAIGVSLTASFVNEGTRKLIPAIFGFSFIGLAIWMLILMCIAGNEGTNKYGNDPKMVAEEISEIGRE